MTKTSEKTTNIGDLTFLLCSPYTCYPSQQIISVMETHGHTVNIVYGLPWYSSIKELCGWDTYLTVYYSVSAN